MLYAISLDANGLPKVIQSTGLTSSGAISGSSDFKRLGYGGPCPPGSGTQRYFFNLYALDTRLNLDRGALKMELADAMSHHILAEGALIRYVSEEVARGSERWGYDSQCTTCEPCWSVWSS